MNKSIHSVSVISTSRESASVHHGGSAMAASNHCSDCFLQNHCLASELDDDCRTQISAITDHPKPFQKGSHIYRQGSAFTHVYIVRSGAVKTYYLDEEGEENISGFYLPGEMFGIDGVGAGGHRYSAQSLDTTAVCAIDFADFEALFGEFPSIQRQFTNVLCDELYARQQPLLRLRQYPAEERLSAFLLDIAERVQRRNKNTSEFNLPMPRRDIARYLCLAEETLSRLFRRLQDRDMLAIRGRKVAQFNRAAFLDSTTACH